MRGLKAENCSSSVSFVLAWSPFVFNWRVFPGVEMTPDSIP